MSLFNNQWPCKLKAEVKRFWDLTGSAPTIALAWLASVMLTFFRSDCTFRPHLSACHIGHIYLSKWWGMITDHRFWLCAAWSLDHTVPSSFSEHTEIVLCSWQFIKQMHQRGQGDDCLTSSSIPAPKCVSMVLCCKQLSWQSVRRLQEGTCRTSPSGGWPKVKCIDT